MLLGAGLVTLVALTFYADSGDDRPGPAPTTPTTEPGFPPAGAESLCREVVTTGEVGALVGRPLVLPVIEPIPGNCAWPSERGDPRDADAYLVVEDRGERSLAEQIEHDFRDIAHRVEPVPGVGDEAFFVLRFADVEGREGDEFVEGIHVHAGPRHVVLANGGRDVWPGPVEAVKAQLAELIDPVLARLTRRLDA